MCRKDESGAEITKRTKEAALEILMQHKADIMSSTDPAARFGELAAIHSDCSSARNAGSLGQFGRGQMQKVWHIVAGVDTLAGASCCIAVVRDLCNFASALSENTPRRVAWLRALMHTTTA